jgi:hypothetical protein
MDDDLMSLRGSEPLSGGKSGGSLDENPLGLDLDDFTPAAPPPAAAPPPEFDDPYSMATSAPIAPSAPIKKAAPPKAKPKARTKPKARSSSSRGGFLGLTPQQGMVLSIFLFLDVAVMGCLILAVLNLLPI